MSDNENNDDGYPLLIEMYKMNDSYHNNKDNLIWSCSALYFTLVSTMDFFIIKEASSINRSGLSYLLLGVTIFSLVLILYQTWYKSKSVYITELMNDIIRDNGKVNKKIIIDILKPVFIRKKKLNHKLLKYLDLYERKISCSHLAENNAIEFEKIRKNILQNSFNGNDIGKIEILFKYGRTGMIISGSIILLSILQYVLLYR